MSRESTLKVPSVGSVWLSGDPRDNGRHVRIERLSESGQFAFVRRVKTGRSSRIHISRFDGKQWLAVT